MENQDFLTIRSILRPLEIFYGHLVYFVAIWCIFPRFGFLDQEKSGNPAFVTFKNCPKHANNRPLGEENSTNLDRTVPFIYSLPRGI
jgi:hypothetical protein